MWLLLRSAPEELRSFSQDLLACFAEEASPHHHHPQPTPLPRETHFVIVEMPVDGEAVALDPPLFTGGAKVPPAAHPHVTPRPHQLGRLFQLSFEFSVL